MPDLEHDSAPLGELIERLEKAKAGSRELNREIFVSAGGIKRWDGAWLGHAFLGADIPAYTTSLDAIVSLMEKRLPDWWVQYLGQTTGGWAVRIERQGLSVPESTRPIYAPTAPLALCIAFLRALNTTEGGTA